MYYRSKQPLKLNDCGVRAIKYANGKCSLSNQLLTEISSGLSLHAPSLCDEGTGGTYFMKNKSNKNAAVFKPKDEDPLSPNNPKKQTIHGFNGFQSGEGVFREVLAFQLEPSLVPETFIAEVKHPMFSTTKVGSLQQFVQNAESTEEYGPSLYSLDDVHRIALLDIRIVNCDRNGENILVKRENNKHRLIPIDHAFSLPAYKSLDNLRHFEWMNYRQSKMPISQDTKDLIHNIDIEKDIILAKSMGIHSDNIVSMQIAHVILMKGVQYNKSFYDIGKFMCSSELHSLCKRDFTSVNQLLEEVSSLSSSAFR